MRSEWLRVDDWHEQDGATDMKASPTRARFVYDDITKRLDISGMCAVVRLAAQDRVGPLVGHMWSHERRLEALEQMSGA